MWYITVVFFLSVFSVIELANRGKGMTFAFNFLWLVLTLMLMFRYGQGTDYYEYFLQYEYIDTAGAFFVNALGHGEIGWYMLMLLAKKIGIDFYLYIGIISMIMMASIYRFIARYSGGRIFSLLLLFPTYYLTYCYSVLRQGLVLALFLGFGVDLLYKKKYVLYLIFISCLVLIHTSAVILLILPLFINWRGKQLLAVLGLVISFVFVTFYSRRYVAIGYEGGAGIAGIVLRFILFYFVWLLHNKCKSNNNVGSDAINLLYKLYLIGFLISLVFAASGTLSQRISAPLKAIEIALIPTLLLNIKPKIPCRVSIPSNFLLVFYLILLMANVEFVKNIYSYMEQGNYREWVTPLDYPYITIYEKNDIYKYITNFDDEV